MLRVRLRLHVQAPCMWAADIRLVPGVPTLDGGRGSAAVAMAMTADRPIGRLTLADEADLCEGSGLSAETILDAGLRSVSRQEASSELGYGVGSGGLVFPYPSINGQPPYARVKLHDAGPDGKRYRAPRGAGNRLYLPAVRDWPAVMRDPTIPLVGTEGEKKTLRAN
jgi:hypothetical protein